MEGPWGVSLPLQNSLCVGGFQESGLPSCGIAEHGAALGQVWAGPGKGLRSQSRLPSSFLTPTIPSTPKRC